MAGGHQSEALVSRPLYRPVVRDDNEQRCYACFEGCQTAYDLLLKSAHKEEGRTVVHVKLKFY